MDHVLPDGAVLADLGTLHDVGEVPNLGALADRAGFVDVGSFVGEVFFGFGGNRCGSGGRARNADAFERLLTGPEDLQHPQPFVAVGDRRAPVGHAVEEVAALGRQRFGLLHSTATASPLTALRRSAGPIDAVGIEQQFLFGSVVENAICSEPTTTNFCSFEGWSQLTKMWAVTPLRNRSRLRVTSTTPGVR